LGKHGSGNGGGNGVKPPTSPGWMVTYGDFMTLLLTFFVLLLSYSTIQEEEFKRALASFQEALGMLPHERSLIQFERVPTLRASPPIPPREVIRRIRNAIYSAGLKGQMKVARDREGIRITIKSPILFDSGKADLRPGAFPVLDELILILQQNPNVVVVEALIGNYLPRGRSACQGTCSRKGTWIRRGSTSQATANIIPSSPTQRPKDGRRTGAWKYCLRA